MNHSLMVVLMAVGMFISTFLIGYLPTKFSTSPKWMNLIAIYGAGLLVGAAIIVILPEGMLVLFESMVSQELINEIAGHSTQESQETDLLNNTLANKTSLNQTQRTLLAAESHGHSSLFDGKVVRYAGLSLIFGFCLMLILDQGFLIIQERAMLKLRKDAQKLADISNNSLNAVDLKHLDSQNTHSPKKLDYHGIKGGTDHETQ